MEDAGLTFPGPNKQFKSMFSLGHNIFYNDEFITGIICRNLKGNKVFLMKTNAEELHINNNNMTFPEYKLYNGVLLEDMAVKDAPEPSNYLRLSDINTCRQH